jgi:hypothetical protein
MKTIQQDIEELKKTSTQFLRDEYKRMHKISDTSELTKSDLVWRILIAKYGQKRIDEYCLPKKEIKK